MKRRRIVRRNKSPDDLGFYQPKGRTSSGRKINASRNGGDNDNHVDQHVKNGPPPSPPVDLGKPPKSDKFNFIPSLGEFCCAIHVWLNSCILLTVFKTVLFLL